MESRLTVGRMALDHVCEGSTPSSPAIALSSNGRTSGSEPLNLGSIPSEAALTKSVWCDSISLLGCREPELASHKRGSGTHDLWDDYPEMRVRFLPSLTCPSGATDSARRFYRRGCTFESCGGCHADSTGTYVLVASRWIVRTGRN
jgi:hypothetical protein